MLENNTLNTNGTTNVSVSIVVGDVKVQFNGSAESVLGSVVSFLAKQVPMFDLAKKISLNYSISELINFFSNFIKITPEGPRVILEHQEMGKKKLSDKEVVALQLVAAKIAKDLGKYPDDQLQLSEIQLGSTLNPKSVSSRLSELVKAGHVQKDSVKDSSESANYKITTSGIQWLNSILVKKTRE